jgi:hypothetical protein
VNTGTIIGLAIAVGTLLVTLGLGLSRLRHERTLADLGDARSILAEGAAELKRIGDSLENLYGDLMPVIALREDHPEALDALMKCRETLREAQAVQGGLRIRFPQESLLVASFDQALKEAFQMTLEVEHLIMFPKRDRPETEDQMHAAWLKFRERHDSYLTTAQRSVGSALPA